MSKWILFIAAFVLITACATTKPPASTAAQGTQQQMVVSRSTRPEGQKLICTESYPMGSHIPQRICVTQAEAAARKKADQQAMQNLQMQGAQSQGTGNNPP
ncbi:MAG TPA: hypothetical protein VNI53_04925 [Gammaproteobacteria bacterium]|nr:hypothetical protein [Gammaproteobacteria bacterium]